MDTYLMIALTVWIGVWMAECVAWTAQVEIPTSAWYIAVPLLAVGLFPAFVRTLTLFRRMRRYKTGQHVVYAMQKSGLHPGPRSENVCPSKPLR